MKGLYIIINRLSVYLYLLFNSYCVIFDLPGHKDLRKFSKRQKVSPK